MAEKSSRRRQPSDEDDDDRPQRRRRYESDDDDDDKDRPRKSKTAAGGNRMLLVGILGAGVLVVGIALVIVFTRPKKGDNQGGNVDQTLKTNKAPKIDGQPKPSGGYSFKLAHKASTSFEVTFKKDHLIEVHSFAPVLISVYGAKGQAIMNSEDRTAFLAFKNTEKRTVIVSNNSIGAAEGVLEVRQTPQEPMAEPKEKSTIPLEGGFAIPPDVPLYRLVVPLAKKSLGGRDVYVGSKQWINTLSPKDARSTNQNRPFKLFELDMQIGTSYTIEVRSGDFTASIHKYDPDGGYLGAETTSTSFTPKQNGPHRFAVTAIEPDGEGPFVVNIISHKGL